MLINEMYDDDDDEEICLVKFYSQFFHAINTKKRQRALCIRRQSHSRPQLYSEMWIDLYTEKDFFLTFRLKRSTFQQLLNLISHQQEFQKVSKII